MGSMVSEMHVMSVNFLTVSHLKHELTSQCGASSPAMAPLPRPPSGTSLRSLHPTHFPTLCSRDSLLEKAPTAPLQAASLSPHPHGL